MNDVSGGLTRMEDRGMWVCAYLVDNLWGRVGSTAQDEGRHHFALGDVRGYHFFLIGLVN